jgi:hypothetical protein
MLERNEEAFMKNSVSHCPSFVMASSTGSVFVRIPFFFSLALHISVLDRLLRLGIGNLTPLTSGDKYESLP